MRNIPYLGSLDSLYFLSKVKTAYFIQGTRTRTFRKSGPGPLKKAYPIPKFTVWVKDSFLIWKIMHIEKNPSKARHWWTSLGCSKNSWGPWKELLPQKILQFFFAHLSLESVFPVLNLTQSCYMNMNVSFSYKLAI